MARRIGIRGGRKCARKMKLQPQKNPRINKMKAETMIMKKLLSKEPDTLTTRDLEKIGHHLRVFSTKPVKQSGYKGIASKVTMSRKRFLRKSSETRSMDSDGSSTSSRDENQNNDTNWKQKNRKMRKNRALFNPIGKLLSANFVRRNMKWIEWNESEELIQNELRVRESIAADPELRGYKRKISPRLSYSQMKTISRVVEMVLLTGDGNEKIIRGTGNIIFDQKLLSYIKKEKYVPPKDRIQMIEKQSEDWKTDVAVYTDLQHENPKTASIPSTMLYKFAERNHFDDVKYPELTQISKTVLKCDCCSGEGAMTNCYGNQNCPCFKRNVRLRGVQTVQDQVAHEKTKFSTFEPILIRNNDSFYDTFGFACSEECGCKGRCNNNVTLLLEKNIHQLEVFRKNETMGFGLRTKTAIPRGTPIMEFVGELIGGRVDNDYAFAAFHKDEKLNESIPAGFDRKSERELLKATMRAFESEKGWHIDPTKIGNLARTCCHSCEPNLAMVRVFQKGFSPAHCRLILVTQEVVFPGVELSFDYGKEYIKNNLKDKCLCGKPSCKNSELYGMMRNASEIALEMYQGIRYHLSYHNYKKDVLDKISAN